jgi:putative transferase (TIGR04331 family)
MGYALVNTENYNERYLITTADERTWKFDRNVIFLGEWCRRHERKHIWQHMNATVALPYGLGIAKKDADHDEARRIEERLFPILCETLNRHHDVQYGERFWRMVLGHWFRLYVNVMLNRVRTLQQCLQAHAISGTTVHLNDQYSLATADSYSAIWACNDARWNNALFGHILALLPISSCRVNFIALDDSTCFHFKALTSASTLGKSTLRWGHEQLQKIANYFVKEDDSFIINSYLPRIEEIKLKLALRQSPKSWISPKFEVLNRSNRELRNGLANKIMYKSSNNLETILNSMVFQMLPICYLEGFADLRSIASKQVWPKKPKFIFTSNNFDTDEVFKLWAADKVESGTKYFVGQHGNCYGTSRYMNPAIEEITADKFLSWGWTDGLPQHTPTFILKMAGEKALRYSSRGRLLLIQDMTPQQIDTWDASAEHAIYLSEQINFTSKLSADPFSRLTVRLHSSHVYNNPLEKERWYKINPIINIDTGSTPIRDLIAQSRLVVHSYDSTGILETLSQNIPTLAFWGNGFSHLRESAKPHYQLLVDAGIVHLTSESCATKVNEVWKGVDTWWSQDNIQDARIQFCKRYAKLSKNPIWDLKKLLTTNDQ